jgi:hypothetical protein
MSKSPSPLAGKTITAVALDDVDVAKTLADATESLDLVNKEIEELGKVIPTANSKFGDNEQRQCDWILVPEDDHILATHGVTGKTFKGSIALFNEQFKG